MDTYWHLAKNDDNVSLSCSNNALDIFNYFIAVERYLQRKWGISSTVLCDYTPLEKKGCYNPIWCHKTDMDQIFVLPVGWNWHEMYLWLSSNNIWPHLGRNFTSMPSESPAERWCCNMWANTHQSPCYVPSFVNNLKGECFYYIVMVVIIQKLSIFKGGSAKSPYKLEYVWVAVSFKVDLAI